MTAAPWFVAERQFWTDDEIALPEDESHHALHVLRVAPLDVITVFDGKGTIARCAVKSTDQGTVTVEILERDVRRPLAPEVVVYQGAAKGSKHDGVIERLAELGVAECRVFSSERAVAQWDAGKVERLGERWAAIAVSAAKQSRNPFIMTTGSTLSWSELVRRIADESFSVCLWEEASLPMRAALVKEAERIALIVGPEGGLTKPEAEALADAGAVLVSLGPRILRTENAAVVAASAVLYHFGLIG